MAKDDSVLPSEECENPQATLDVQKFILIKPEAVEGLSNDNGWRNSIVTLCKCVRDFLAPSCYWNKHWKLSKDDLVLLFEFSFIALRVCFSIVTGNRVTTKHFVEY